MTTGRKASTATDHHARILRVLVYIQEHLDDAISMEDLARVAAYSLFHFHRVFRGMVGETVTEHVRRVRLERAAHQLKHSDTAVVRLAMAAGYETHEAFTRAFRAHFGQSPSEFRRAQRPVPYPSVLNRVHYGGYEPLAEFDPVVGRQTMDVKIEHKPATRVAFVRHQGPYMQSDKAWETLMSWANRRGLVGPQARMLGLSYADPEVVAPEDCRYDACLVVGPEVEPEGEVGVQEIPAGEFAVTLHVGPYEGLKQTYAELMGQWLPRQARAAGDPPSVERYFNNPATTKPEELRTEVAIRLA